MIARLLRAAAALLACAALSTTAAAQDGGSLSGRVTGPDGAPLAGARVTAAAGTRVRAATTGADGRYALAPLPAASYTVTAAALGHAAQTRTVAVAAGGRAEADFTLPVTALRLDAVQVVSTTRTSVPLEAVPGAVTLVSRREVEQQAAVSRGMGELLGKEVPGLSVGTQSMSNYGQTLRGRNVVVLIDGVPQSTLRNVSRDFVNIDPAMVERVEVLRGATALYGDGATGGVINVITRAPGTDRVRYTSEVQAGLGLSTRLGDGTSWRTTHGAFGRTGRLDFALGGAYDRAGRFYDAEGDLLPPDPHGQGGLAETDAYDLFGKTGWTFGPQRLQLSVNHYRSVQETGYTADPSVNQLPPGTAKARAISGVEQEIGQGTRTTQLSVDWTHAATPVGRVHAQAYVRDYVTRFRPFDRRRWRTVTDTADDGTVTETRVLASGQVSQSFVDSEKWGGRLEVESFPLGAGGPSLLWGTDYLYENTSQPVYLMDEDAYDASNGLVFRRVGEAIWVPPLRPRSLAAFAQAAWDPAAWLTVRGGVRHERVRMHVDDFTTLDGNDVTGGDLSYDPVLFNAGAVVRPAAGVSVFGSFSQGFSLADIGRILRGAADGFDLGENRVEAQLVDHYEAGARGAWSRVEASATVFRNSSELGTNFRLVDGMLQVVRAPERIRGVEATLDVRPVDAVGVGGTWTWTEGESRGADGAWRALNGYRVQPPKLTAYVEHRAGDRWTNRLQVLRSGSRDAPFRDRADPSGGIGLGEQPVEAFTVVDWLSTVRVGPGTLRVGVENLLNAQYFDVVSQLEIPDGNAYYTAARGRSLTLGFSVGY